MKISIQMETTDEQTGAAHGGFVLSVSGAKRPGFRWELAPNRLRLVVGRETRLWARSDLSWWHPPWFAHRLDAPFTPIVPPIRSTDVRAIHASPNSEEWWRAWMLWFLKEITISPYSPLHNGTWRMARLKIGLLEKGTAWGYLPWDSVPIAHSVGTNHGQWCVWCASKEKAAQGEVVMLRELTVADTSRVKMWRKRAIDGTLPPILVSYCAPIGLHVVLDGHVRLLAAVEAGKAPPLIVLFPVRAREKRIHDEWREQAWRQAEVDLVQLAGLGPWAMDHINASLIAAFDEAIVYTPTTRAWLLDGGTDAWTEDIERATAQIRNPLVCALRDEMVGDGNIAGPILNRGRILISRPSDGK